MSTCLVSLVSEQTIPNILVALHVKPDMLLLISTAKMEQKGKSQAVLDTLKMRGLDYTNHCHIITVQEDSVIDLQRQVSRWLEESPEEYQFIVNLTGGTKIMSIAAYDLFNDFGSTMIYVPIPKNEYLIPFPKQSPKQSVPLIDRLTVEEYLTAYGITVENRNSLSKYRQEATKRQNITRFIFQQYEQMEPLLSWLGSHLRPLKINQVKKGYDFSQDFPELTEAQKGVLKDLGFQIAGTRISKRLSEQDWNYLRGGWLEERLFLAVQEALPQATDIQLGLRVRDIHGNQNEFDVLFTCENILYLIECKSLESKSEEFEAGGTVTDFLYKLGTLRQQFGLTPRAFLATTARSIYEKPGKIKDHLIKRTRQSGSEIIPLLQVNDLESYLRSRLICAA